MLSIVVGEELGTAERLMEIGDDNKVCEGGLLSMVVADVVEVNSAGETVVVNTTRLGEFDSAETGAVETLAGGLHDNHRLDHQSCPAVWVCHLVKVAVLKIVSLPTVEHCSSVYTV